MVINGKAIDQYASNVRDCLLKFRLQRFIWVCICLIAIVSVLFFHYLPFKLLYFVGILYLFFREITIWKIRNLTKHFLKTGFAPIGTTWSVLNNISPLIASAVFRRLYPRVSKQTLWKQAVETTPKIEHRDNAPSYIVGEEWRKRDEPQSTKHKLYKGLQVAIEGVEEVKNTMQFKLAKEYVSSKYNFSVRYPADWEIVFTDEHEASWVKPVGIAGPKDTGGRPGFTVLISVITSEGSIDSYMKKAQGDLEQIFGRISVLKAEQREVNGSPAAWMEYTYRGGVMQELNVTLFMGEWQHVLIQFICESPADTFAVLFPIFLEMIKSVHFANNRLALPHVELIDVQRCGICARDFGTLEAKFTFFDARQQDVITLCRNCKESERKVSVKMNSKEINTVTIEGHSGIISSLAFSPDGAVLASGGKDSTIGIWDVKSGQCQHKLTGHTANVRKAVFCPDKPILASGSHDHFVKLWDYQKGELLATLGPHGGAMLGGVGPISFSPDGKFLASPGGKTFRIWDIESKRIVREIKHSAGWIAGCMDVSFSPDGKKLYSVSRGDIRVWDTTTWRDLGQIGSYPTISNCWIAISPDGKLLAAYGWNPVRIWDTQSRRNVADLDVSSITSPDLAFFSDGMRILITADAGVAIWDIPSQRLLQKIPVTEFVGAVAIAPDQITLALGFPSGKIEIRTV